MGTFCDETETADHKQKEIVAANIKEDHKCSKKMEVDEGLNLNTVACLRGRLLAERLASKVAKEQAESMANKLVELEKLLKEEIKLRDKSEKKLRLLRKKVESFSISSKSRQLGNSDSSEKCENSCGSSSISSNSKYSEFETQICGKNEALTENVVPNHNVSEAQNSSCSSTTKDCDSQITDSFSSNCSDLGYSSPQILSKNPNPSSDSEDLKNDKSRLSNLSTKSSVTENESDHADSFDNSLALVPVTVKMTATSQAISNHKPVNESVFEALDALRVAKEKLQSSLGSRQMIHIGLV